MAKKNQPQVEFILSLLRTGKKRGEILTEFGRKWQKVSERTFDRRMKDAQAALEAEQARVQHQAEQVVIDKVKERADEIMTAFERKAILSRIARGQLKIDVQQPKWNPGQENFSNVPVTHVPDYTAIVGAIKELNKMDGSYSPVKQEHIITETKLPSWMVKNGSEEKEG